MIDLIKRVLHDCSTGIDGTTFSPVRIVGYSSCSGAVIIYFANAVYMAFTKSTFDYVSFGSGFALIMGALLAVGAAEAVKTKTEPGEK